MLENTLKIVNKWSRSLNKTPIKIVNKIEVIDESREFKVAVLIPMLSPSGAIIKVKNTYLPFYKNLGLQMRSIYE